MNDFFTNEMLETFLFESESLLDQLDEVLLAAEKTGSLSADDINEIFRIMHTIKGSSAMMELDLISSVTHKLEDCFFHIREHGLKGEHFTELFDLMLDAIEFLKSQLELIRAGGQSVENNVELVQRIASFYSLLVGKESKETATSSDIPAESALNLQNYQIHVTFEEGSGMENLRAFMLEQILQDHGDVIETKPAGVESNPETAAQIVQEGFFLDFKTALPLEALRSIVEKAPHVASADLQLKAVPGQAKTEPTAERVHTEQFHIVVQFDEDCDVANLRAFLLLEALRKQGTVLDFSPSDIETNPKSAEQILREGFHVSIDTALTAGRLTEVASNFVHVAAARVEPKKTAASGSDSDGTGRQRPVKQDLIAVSLSKLDEMMDLVGELVITESMLIRSPAFKELAKMEQFQKASRQLRKITDDLQDMVMSVRMIPVAGTFHKMQRIVREMSRSLGKEADLVLNGEETNIDKAIIDGISDPIMHLVRNCMDHGIELPEERTLRGKPTRGTITLSAVNTGGEILITVMDDGKGLDARKLLMKAEQQGLLTKPAAEYTEKDIYQMVMLPGFSTKEEVTEFSGRGVGMDVVKKKIESVGGTVIIESRKNRGTSIHLKIPLTLAIVDGMDLAVGDSVYTLPITAIQETFRPYGDRLVKDTEGNEMILLRGNVYPIIRLHQLYDVPSAITDISEGILIWAKAGDESVCLFADHLIGEQQIVVKPLPSYLSHYNVKSLGISGCTIRGDGNISLILDVSGIIEKTSEKR